MKKIVLLSLLSFQIFAEESKLVEPVTAPTPPGSEILLFDYKVNDSGAVTLSNGINITHSPGYDSQPRFSNDGALIYYTHFDDSSGQMDINQYDVTTGKTTVYIATAESEYSPTPMPEANGISVVQVDANGDQYLVLLQKNEEAKRYSDLKQVGYFNWTQGKVVWSFMLNDNNGGDLYIQGADLEAEKLAENVGRSFITDASNQSIYYVDKNTQPWRIKSRTSKAAVVDVMGLPVGVEDFTLDTQGRFWAGRDNTLYVSLDQKRWFIAHEFNDPKLHQISRVTTNPSSNKIAVVFAEISNNE
ncbi:TolB family protein [Marinicella litoralis]|uniref:WD40 repeat protein n=1 Tax=Marinicella litoralis TaxID=644220 RepID=A0A4R6XWA5_9GAMM|nr:PD40 domain-containing protein [Marinicella litoralis]TDR22417.1 WD40 repeat protein [Marinicella litoralis]